MNVDNSKYGVFMDNYNRGMNQFLEEVSARYFSRINFDTEVIINKINDDYVKGKLSQIEQIKANNSDNFNKLKITGKILLDIAPIIWNNVDAEIKRSTASIINGFYDVAKETEDEELLRTAGEISNSLATK